MLCSLYIPCKTKLRTSSTFLSAPNTIYRGRSVPGAVPMCPPNTLDRPTADEKEFGSGKEILFTKSSISTVILSVKIVLR